MYDVILRNPFKPLRCVGCDRDDCDALVLIRQPPPNESYYLARCTSCLQAMLTHAKLRLEQREVDKLSSQPGEFVPIDPHVYSPGHLPPEPDFEPDLAVVIELDKRALAAPWVADIDDVDSDSPFWTGKFYCGHDTSPNWGTWCTYNNDEIHTLPNLRLVEYYRSAAPLMAREILTLRAQVAQLREAVLKVQYFTDDNDGSVFCIGCSKLEGYPHTGACPIDRVLEATQNLGKNS